MKKKPYTSIGHVPPHIAPSEEVVYLGEAIVAGTLAWLVLFIVGLTVSHVLVGSGGWAQTVWHGFAGVFYLISFGQSFAQDLADFRQGLSYPTLLPSLMLGSGMLATVVSFVLIKKLLKPKSNQRHLQGDELQTGEEADRYAQKHSKVEQGPFDIHIGPLRVQKEQANRGFLISGGIGSGKTVIMAGIYEQFIKTKGSKSILYDVKGDYTERFPEAVIISPFDARTAVWDMAHDLRTQTQIQNMAQAFFPSAEGKDKFFQQAAQGVFMASLLHVYHHKGNEWTIKDLEDVLNRNASEHLATALMHDPKTALLISDPDCQTTSSVMATMASGTRVLTSLSQAWSDPMLIDGNGKPVLDKDGNPRKRQRFSLMEWMKDDNDPTKDWSRAPRHVILQGGPDRGLTRAYINAMLNVLTPEMISVAFPDNQHGRHVGIFLDEMPSLGKLDLGGLLDQGRSKGIVNCWAFQDIAQLEEVYGANLTKAMYSMVGTKVLCQIGTGATRKMLAEQFGAKQVVQVAHKEGAVGQEIGKAVVYEDILTNALGKYTDKDKQGNSVWGIRAIVHTSGLNPMLLRVPGKSYPPKRKPLVRALWTKSLPIPGDNSQARVVEQASMATEIKELHEAATDVQAERVAKMRFMEDKADYYRNLNAMRHSSRSLGLDEDEIFELLEQLKPTYRKRKPTSPRLGGFIRS